MRGHANPGCLPRNITPTIWPVQAKLAINQPGDRYEQEADRIAEQVMRMPEPRVVNRSEMAKPPLMRRSCPKCRKKAGERKYDEERLQMKSLSTPATYSPQIPSSNVPPIVHDVLRSPGRPLDASTRAFMEPRFGHDFKEVRVQDKPATKHPDDEDIRKIQKVAIASYASITPDYFFKMATTGSGQPVPYQREMEEAFAENFDNVRAYPGRAGEMRMLDAVAATRGTFIAFRDTHPSRETVAHELVHVVQQRLHGIVSPLSLGQISNPEEPAEREATRLAFRVAEGKKVAINQSINGRIAREVAVPMIGDIEEKSESQA